MANGKEDKLVTPAELEDRLKEMQTEMEQAHNGMFNISMVMLAMTFVSALSSLNAARHASRPVILTFQGSKP